MTGKATQGLGQLLAADRRRGFRLPRSCSTAATVPAISNTSASDV